MKILLTHQTAEQYWRAAHGVGHRVVMSHSDVDDFAPTKQSLSYARRVLDLPVDAVLHVGVFRPNDRRNLANCVTHLLTVDQLVLQACRIADGVYAATPEHAFLQACRHLSLAQQVQFGFELCGAYGLRGNREALCALPEIHQWLSGFSVGRNRAQSARAADLILENSASPAETVLGILLMFPKRLGGFGLPAPKLNYRIELSPYSQNLAGRSFCRADFCWPEKKLIAEYDSDEFHLNSGQFTKDAIRRNALERDGFTVVTITKGQLFDLDELARTVGVLAHHLGLRIRITTSGFHEKQAALMRELLARW